MSVIKIMWHIFLIYLAFMAMAYLMMIANTIMLGVRVI